MAERRGVNPDDPVLSRLHELESSLSTIQRRLRSAATNLD